MKFYFNYTDDKRTTPEGKRQFTLDWTDGERRRGQYFFAIPAEHVARLRENGHEVVEGVTAPWRRSLEPSEARLREWVADKTDTTP